MNLQQYLDETANCELVGRCYACKYEGILERLPPNSSIHAMYRCPNCQSVFVQLDRITEIAQDGTFIIIFERK